MRIFLLSVTIGTLAVAASAQTPAPARGAAPAPMRGAAPAPTRDAAQPHARGAAPKSPAHAEQVPSTGSAQPQSAAAAPPPPPPYTYQVGGRRDPFRTLLPPIRTAGPAIVTSTPPEKIEGPKDMNVSEITVKGVLQNGSTYIAMVLGPNGKTYVVHPGDALRNGTIRSISAQGLVIVQDVNDPLSTQRQREVRKLLRSFEEAK